MEQGFFIARPSFEFINSIVHDEVKYFGLLYLYAKC